MTTELPDEGVVIVPRRIGWAAVVGGFIFLAGQIWFFAETKASIQADIIGLQRADVEARSRGDDIRRRLQDLENQRDRITRVEEQLKVMLDMLREVREELRKKS